MQCLKEIVFEWQSAKRLIVHLESQSKVLDIGLICLEVLTQLENAEIARPNVVTRVRTRDLTVVCEFIFSGLPLHLRPKKKKKI
jgi:hypothetical protein